MVIQADSHSAEVLRRAFATLLGGVTNGTPGGVVAAGDLLVSAGAGNSLSVAVGEVWIPGNSMAHMGAYYGYNDSVVTLGVTPNGSNPLYAIVTASVNDQAYTGNPGVANNTWNLLLTQGAPAPSPTVPATPANSLLLATALVPASAASSASYTITDNRIQSGKPTCKVYRAAAYADVNSVTTLCPFDSILFDSAKGFSPTTHLYTCPSPGDYLVTGGWGRTTGFFAGHAMITFIYKNGGVYSAGNYSQWTANGSDLQSTVVDVVRCAAGDTLSLAYDDYGGGGAQTTAANCFMSIAKQG